MVYDDAVWREELSRYRQELERFLTRVRGLQQSLGKALRAGDAESGLRLLEGVERAAALGIPTFPSADEWRERLDAERRRSELEFKSRLQEALKPVEQAIRDETGEGWVLGVEGTYPSYTVGEMVRVDARRFRGDVRRTLRTVEREVRAATRKRFSSAEAFVECLYVAYRMATVVDEIRGARASPSQGLRRLQRLMPAAMGELGVGRGQGTYSLLAFGVDLGRCLLAGVREARGARVELVQTKHAEEGVRVFIPGQQSRIYGKVEFRKGG